MMVGRRRVIRRMRLMVGQPNALVVIKRCDMVLRLNQVKSRLVFFSLLIFLGLFKFYFCVGFYASFRCFVSFIFPIIPQSYPLIRYPHR